MARALVLTGGGVTGALYEVGVLRATEERYGSPLDLFDLFVGISAGASVAAFIAQGVSPTRLYEALLDRGDQLFPLEQRHVAALDLARALRLAGTAASLALRALGRMIVPRQAPTRATTPDLPSGLFDTEPYRRFLATTLAERGLSDDFRRLPRPLLVPATDLDTARRVTFGEPPWDDVPISAAVAASSAIPGFFEPVSLRGRELVDGNVATVAHLDLVAARGIADVVVVSPRAPVENAEGPCIVPGEDGQCLSLRERGLWAVHDQAARVEHQERLHLGMARFRLEHPTARVALIEPERSDGTLFLANPMGLSARREVLERGLGRGRALLDAGQLTLEAA
jgi:predicted acylesterase/phospholipase RssA